MMPPISGISEVSGFSTCYTRARLTLLDLSNHLLHLLRTRSGDAKPLTSLTSLIAPTGGAPRLHPWLKVRVSTDGGSALFAAASASIR